MEDLSLFRIKWKQIKFQKTKGELRFGDPVFAPYFCKPQMRTPEFSAALHPLQEVPTGRVTLSSCACLSDEVSKPCFTHVALREAAGTQDEMLTVKYFLEEMSCR